MPIGNKNENDGTTKDLNENLSGLTISDKKTQAPQQQSSTNNGSEKSTNQVYVPPSKRNLKPQGGNSGYNNNNYSSRDRDSNYNNNYNNRDQRDNNNYNSRDNYNRNYNDSPKPSTQSTQPTQPTQPTQQPLESSDNLNGSNGSTGSNGYRNNNNGSYNNGGSYNNNYNNNGGGYNNNNSGGYYNKGGYSNNSGGGYNNSSPSFNRNSPSPFNRGTSGGGFNKGGSGGKIDRYFERWQKFKDSRKYPEIKREINFDEEIAADEKAKELFNAKADQGDVINFDSYDDDEISIETSENICSPLNTFTDVDLGDTLLYNIKMAKYTKPTPVQKSALPIILKGRDLMACAQTGSGKTAAFLFPIISGILLEGAPEPPAAYRPGVPRASHPRALVLAPTRELAQQIYEESNKFSYGSPVASVVIYGGAEVSGQINELEKGCDILVATTGRLVDLLMRGRVALDKVKYLVLDEADRMLDMGFEPQIRQIISDFDMNKNGDRQTLMFSATFPKQIQNLASDFLDNYVFLKVGVVGTTQNITQRIEYVPEDEKNSHLLDYLTGLKSDGLTLIFVETKRSCDTLTYFLNQRNFPAICIHGDLSQGERENALQSFRSFQTPFLVATDIASRGLHIGNVNLVINFDLPTDVHVYVHRIGRTGRAGKRGLAISFFNEKNKPVGQELLKLMKASNQDIPDWFEKTVHSYKSQKMPPNSKSKSYDSPFQKSYHNNNNNYNRYSNNNNNRNNNHSDDRNDRRPSHSNNSSSSSSNGGYSNYESNDYSMHHFNNSGGGSYN